jgi:hypothetical protein
MGRRDRVASRIMHASDALCLVMASRTMNLVAPCQSRLTGSREPLSMDDGSFRLKMIQTVPAKSEVGRSTIRAESGRTVRHPPVWLTVDIVNSLNDRRNVSSYRSVSFVCKILPWPHGKS